MHSNVTAADTQNLFFAPQNSVACPPPKKIYGWLGARLHFQNIMQTTKCRLEIWMQEDFITIPSH